MSPLNDMDIPSDAVVTPERTRTTFPGGGAARKRPGPTSHDGGRTSLQKRRFLQSDRQPVPRLPIKVNPESSLFMHYVRNPISIAAAAGPSVSPATTSWALYRKLIQEDQAGSALVCHRNQPDFGIVAVKTRQLAAVVQKDRIKTTSHPNIVNIEEVFEHEGTINFVYESFTVTLADIQASPCGLLQEYEIAAICQSVCEFGASREYAPLIGTAIGWSSVCCRNIGHCLFG